MRTYIIVVVVVSDVMMTQNTKTDWLRADQTTW